MIIFPTGINLTLNDVAVIKHREGDVEAWVLRALQEKIRARKEALLAEWIPRLLSDPNVTTIPGSEADILAVIFAHPDYQDRVTSDPDGLAQYTRWPATRGSVKLFPTGINIDDLDAKCLLSSIFDIEDWVRRGVIGRRPNKIPIGAINRGKKKMIQQYLPVLLADPAVATLPATEDELIAMITARSEYKTLPAQIE